MSLQKSLLALQALLLLTIASSAPSTTCGSNPLLRKYGFTTTFSDAQIVPGLKYCKSLQGQETCCDADTINSFQDKADELLQRLSSAIGKRDQSLIQIRNDVLPSLTGKLAALKSASDKAATKIQATVDAGGSGDSTIDQMNTLTLSLATNYSAMAKTLTGSLSVLRSTFNDYQKARSTCVVEIVKIQAAAWCLACDPEYTSKSVSFFGIGFSSNLKETLTDSCIAYLNGAVTQSMLYSMSLMSNYLSDITAAFTSIANDDTKGLFGFMNILNNMASTQSSLTSASMPIELPSGCTAEQCDWTSSTMFFSGQLDEISLALGGIRKSSGGIQVDERRLQNLLPTNGWDPDSDEAGVRVTFSNNPGGVDNSSAALFKSIIGGLVVLLSVLFI